MKGSLPLYEQTAESIRDLIRNGSLKPGDRAPSVRKLSRQQRVSVSTVLQAYVTLENWGMLEARERSGYYVRLPAQELPPEPQPRFPARTGTTPVTVGELIAQVFRAAQDPDVVPLGVGCPSPELLPVHRLGAIMRALLRRNPSLNAEYSLPPGDEAFRRQIALRAFEFGCRLKADDILTTNGCAEAIFLCLKAVTRAGDTVAIESPTYFGTLQMIDRLGLRALEIPCHPSEGLDLAGLEAAIEKHKVKACVAMPNFQNPLGGVMPEENKKRLVRVLAKAGIPLIEDDIYGDIGFGATRPRPCKAFDREGLVLWCGSFSKTIAPGLRVGWCAPGKFAGEVEILKATFSCATPTLAQAALGEFLAHGGYDRHLRKLRRSFHAQTSRAAKAVALYFPQGTRVSRPQGSFFLWVELPKSVDALKLHAQALREKIAIIPGPAFSASGKYGHSIRLSCGHPWSPVLEKSVRRLGEIAGKLARD